MYWEKQSVLRETIKLLLSSVSQFHLRRDVYVSLSHTWLIWTLCNFSSFTFEFVWLSHAQRWQYLKKREKQSGNNIPFDILYVVSFTITTEFRSRISSLKVSDFIRNRCVVDMQHNDLYINWKCAFILLVIVIEPHTQSIVLRVHHFACNSYREKEKMSFCS